MQLMHSFNDASVKKEGEASFLLTDKSGGYFSLANKKTNYSQYQGWCVFLPEKWTSYKVIENIRLESEPEEVENCFYKIRRKTKNTENSNTSNNPKSGSTEEEFLLTQDALIYEVKEYEGFVYFDLDFREIHDFDDKGRIYSTKKQGDELIITYRKYADDSCKKQTAKFHLVVKGVQSYGKTGKWTKKDYSYDKERKTKNEFYIYEAIKIKISGKKKLVFTFSKKEEEAVKTARKVYANIPLIKKSLYNYFKKEITGQDFALDCAKKSLDDLTITLSSQSQNKNAKKITKETTGIFAGLPWFFQFWARDEAISLGGLLCQQKYGLVKEIITRYFEKIKPNGKIPNRYPNSDLSSADATGWLCKRTHQLLEALQKQGSLGEHFTKKELDNLRKKVMFIADKTRKITKPKCKKYENKEDNLIYNYDKETWMDTDNNGDFRDGARIEIQALQLSIYKLVQFLCELTKKELGKEYKNAEKELKSKVKQVFFKDGVLADGYNNGKQDFTVRPNIFLAHYIYPGLLTKKEWKQVFENTLKPLWCEWGGLSSIDKNHYWFRPAHTGFNNESYHRGDSWFFVNNIAAISMYSVDKKFFKQYIEKIIEASKEETLFKGYMGHSAEISSASTLCSQGCWAQAWSASTLIEALKLITY